MSPFSLAANTKEVLRLHWSNEIYPSSITCLYYDKKILFQLHKTFPLNPKFFTTMEQHMEHLKKANSAESPAFPSTFENVNNCKNNRQERRRSIPWTEDEHRFLMGLHKYGKGDWRNIARNYVITRTPTQVATHAQKYYLRQLSEGKEKMKPSIHDTPTVDHTNAAPSNNCNFHHIRSLL